MSKVESKKIVWRISKAPGVVNLNVDTIEFNKEGEKMSLNFETPDNNTVVSVTSNNDEVCAVDNTDSDTGVFKLTAGVNGAANVNISVADSVNYSSVSKGVNIIVVERPKENFDDYSWEEIQQIVQSGKAKNYWNVGDTKDIQFPVEIATDLNAIPAKTTYKVVILGFDHNSVKEGLNRLHLCIGKNSNGEDICFSSKLVTNNQYAVWNTSEMKTWLNGTFHDALPSDLKAVITECIKYTNNGNLGGSENIIPTNQKIWIMSEYEVFGLIKWSVSYEQNSQAQYDYYKNGNSKVRYGHSSGLEQEWFLRSPFGGQVGLNCFVNKNGNTGYVASHAKIGVVPCFTIS